MTNSTARAYWSLPPDAGELRHGPLPRREAGQVLVESLYSAISRGTEALVHRGLVPPSQHQAMRAPFQEGDFTGPLKYGYMNVGRVLEGPEDLRGRTVFCLYPHQDRYVVPAGAVMPLPAGLPAARAVLAANMETAVNAVWDAAPGLGDSIRVVGAGVVGCLAAALCARIPGTHVELMDTDPARAGIAHALGVPFRLPGDGTPEADLVLHASGNPAGLQLALELAGVEARIIEMSWYGTREVPLPLGEAFHARRLTIRSSQVGRLPPERSPRWDYRRRLGLALELLRDDTFDALFTGESSFEQLPTTLHRLSHRPDGCLCHRIRYRAADNHDARGDNGHGDGHDGVLTSGWNGQRSGGQQ